MDATTHDGPRGGGTEAVRVVSADDDPGVCLLVAAVVDGIEGLTYAGQAGDGLAVVELIERVAPDLLVLDIDMPGYDGLFALARLRRTHSSLWIVVYSGSSSDELRPQVLAAGANAYVRKGDALSDLRAAPGAGRAR